VTHRLAGARIWYGASNTLWQEVRVKFSLFQMPSCFDRERDGECIEKSLRQAELAEACGFDGVWLSEHHFSDTSVYADPVVFAAAIAARTSRVAIGFGVIQLGLHNPVRLATQLALIDRISGGRIRVGLSRGDNDLEYRGFGMRVDAGRERFDEALEILFKCWTGGDFKHRGAYYDLDVAGVRPSLVQKPHPPLYQSAIAPESIARIGRAGYGLLLGRMTGPDIRDRLDIYREALESAGQPDVDERVRDARFLKNVYVAPTDDEAWDDIREPTERQQRGLAAVHERYLRMLAESGEPLPDHAEAPRVPYKLSPIMERGLIAGSPERVLDQLREQESFGVRHILANMDWGDMPWEKVGRSIRLLAEKVLPALAG
jgi:alkanesulfonate monooxygenase SsuD/methylene tetrahydromethanopterin reductase-like flavin-dependent oxidoreductase (luciferase family)